MLQAHVQNMERHVGLYREEITSRVFRLEKSNDPSNYFSNEDWKALRDEAYAKK